MDDTDLDMHTIFKAPKLSGTSQFKGSYVGYSASARGGHPSEKYCKSQDYQGY